MEKKTFRAYVMALVFLSGLTAVISAHLWQRGTIDPGNVVKLQSHFVVDGNFSRTERYEGAPCVAYRGGYFMAMERFQVPFFEDRGRSLELIRVSYVPANADALKDNECAFGTSFRTQANTWFAWKDGDVFVFFALKRVGE